MTASFAVPARADVPVEETWALETIFPDDAAWEAACAAVDARLSEFNAFRGHVADGAGVLLGAFQLADQLDEITGKIAIYAGLHRAEDATNTHYGEMADRADGLGSRFEAATAFIQPEVAALSDATISAWLAEEPGLALYRVALERISRRRAHIRSTEIEELLARATEMADASEVTQGVLEDGELPLGEIRDESGLPVKLAQGNLQRYLDSADRRVRQETWESSADGYLAFRNTFAATLAGAVKRDVFYARARGYDSSLKAALDYDNIDTTVFHNLLDTVWRNFPVWHRYFRVRRLLLGLPEGDHHVYDLEAPLADTLSFPWQRGVDTILASLAPLGDEYVNEVRRGMAERWVDRAANERQVRHRTIHLDDLPGHPHQRLYAHPRDWPLHAFVAHVAVPAHRLPGLRDVRRRDRFQLQPGPDGRAYAGRA
jgi:oligoendopeptidase F